MQKILLTVCTFACAAAVQAFRPPAVPLVSVDPFFSVWSAADRLADAETTHWSGAKQPITVLLEADGRTWRLCGATPADVPALPQLATEVRPRRRSARSPRAHCAWNCASPRRSCRMTSRSSRVPSPT